MAEASLAGHGGLEFAIVPYTDVFRLQVVSLWSETFAHASLSVCDRDIDVAAARDPCLFYLATEGENLLGTCVGATDNHRSWIYYLSVFSHVRRCGIATQLLRHVECLLRKEGCFQLGLHVRANNRSALDFYRKAGFSQEEALCMGKLLK